LKFQNESILNGRRTERLIFRRRRRRRRRRRKEEEEGEGEVPFIQNCTVLAEKTTTIYVL
jgi:hypothetical protein